MYLAYETATELEIILFPSFPTLSSTASVIYTGWPRKQTTKARPGHLGRSRTLTEVLPAANYLNMGCKIHRIKHSNSNTLHITTQNLTTIRNANAVITISQTPHPPVTTKWATSPHARFPFESALIILPSTTLPEDALATTAHVRLCSMLERQSRPQWEADPSLLGFPRPPWRYIRLPPTQEIRAS